MSNRQCNKCVFEQLKKAHPNSSIETKKKPLEHFPRGIDVYVDGKWLIWFAELPSKCEC
jgi:hypothetical protein